MWPHHAPLNNDGAVARAAAAAVGEGPPSPPAEAAAAFQRAVVVVVVEEEEEVVVVVVVEEEEGRCPRPKVGALPMCRLRPAATVRSGRAPARLPIRGGRHRLAPALRREYGPVQLDLWLRRSSEPAPAPAPAPAAAAAVPVALAQTLSPPASVADITARRLPAAAAVEVAGAAAAGATAGHSRGWLHPRTRALERWSGCCARAWPSHNHRSRARRHPRGQYQTRGACEQSPPRARHSGPPLRGASAPRRAGGACAARRRRSASLAAHSSGRGARRPAPNPCSCAGAARPASATTPCDGVDAVRRGRLSIYERGLVPALRRQQRARIIGGPPSRLLVCTQCLPSPTP